MRVDVERVDFVSFLTNDIARAKAFYTELLRLEVESEGEHDIELRDPDGNALMLHRRYAPFTDGRKP